jgi:hypothetical protein
MTWFCTSGERTDQLEAGHRHQLADELHAHLRFPAATISPTLAAPYRLGLHRLRDPEPPDQTGE